MTSIAYRNAIPNDSVMVADLFARSFIETFAHLYRREDLDAFLSGVTGEAFAGEIVNPAFAVRIATVDETPIGFAKLGPPRLPIETPPATLELCQIYVLREWQGKGVARQLYDWAEAEGRVRGAEHLQLSVYVDNHRARRFYDRRHFVAVGRFDFMVGNHADDEIIMRKAL